MLLHFFDFDFGIRNPISPTYVTTHSVFSILPRRTYYISEPDAVGALHVLWVVRHNLRGQLERAVFRVDYIDLLPTSDTRPTQSFTYYYKLRIRYLIRGHFHITETERSVPLNFAPPRDF